MIEWGESAAAKAGAVPLVFLLGAGASFGAIRVTPSPAPLGRDLYDRLAEQFPKTRGSASQFAGVADELIFVRRSAWYSHLISPKSTRSVATAPMPGPLAELLANYLASCTPNEKRLLFSNRRGNPHSENKVVQKRLWPILDALSIPRCGMHAFRHAHARVLISSGASLKVTQAQLRHADASTTMRAYVHILGSEQREAAEKVARLLCSDVAKSERKPVRVN
jgi:integrase